MRLFYTHHLRVTCTYTRIVNFTIKPTIRPYGLTSSDQIWYGNAWGADVFQQGPARSYLNGAGLKAVANFIVFISNACATK